MATTPKPCAAVFSGQEPFKLRVWIWKVLTHCQSIGMDEPQSTTMADLAGHRMLE
jgi:hypothetical protein